MGSTIRTLKNSTDRMAGMMRRRMGEAEHEDDQRDQQRGRHGDLNANDAGEEPGRSNAQRALATPHQSQASASLKGLLTKRR